MNFLTRFSSDTRGEALKSVALFAFTAAITSIGGANLLDLAMRDGLASRAIAALNVGGVARSMAAIPGPRAASAITTEQVTVDYSPTGSIPTSLIHPVILDPCDGARK